MKIPIHKNSLERGKKTKIRKKMGKFQRELKFLERNVQRVKTKFQKLTYDPALTSSMNTADL